MRSSMQACRSVRVPCFLLSGLANDASAQGITGPSDDGVTTFFGLTDGNVIVGYEFLTEDGNTVVEKANGECIRRINVPKATIAILSPFGPLLAVGEGTLNVHATVDCETLAYNYERVVVTSVGEVIDFTGEEYRMTVRAVIIDGDVKVSKVYFDPI